MQDKLVFIPCRLDRRDAKSALIDDADGWPRKVVGPLGRMAGRLVVAARWLREAARRHRVRFQDGAEWWVIQGPGSPDDFVPLSWAQSRKVDVTRLRPTPTTVLAWRYRARDDAGVDHLPVASSQRWPT